MLTIVDYQPTWTTEFAAIAATLRRGLGDLALRIDHIGSTSVPGLAAKDIIDVQITVAGLDPQVLALLTALGYTRAPGIWTITAHPAARGPTATGKSGSCASRPASASPIPTCASKAVPTSATRSSFAITCAPMAPPPPPTPSSSAASRGELADSTTYPDVKDPAVDLIFFAAEDLGRGHRLADGSIRRLIRLHNLRVPPDLQVLPRGRLRLIAR